MRKTLAIVVTSILLSTLAFAGDDNEKSPNTEEEIILRLLYNPAAFAIEDYYGEPRQYWNDKVLSAQQLPNTPYYKVVVQVETFYGAHNPPYGIETMTFYVSYGQVELKKFEHQDDPC